MADFVIRNGRVIDPHNGIDEITDIVIENGRIARIGKLQGIFPSSTIAESSTEVPSLNASGCIVTPGLIDCHVHAYEHCTPLGINVDRTCLARGVTSVVDAGSAGSTTFPGLRHFIATQSTTRVYAFLHVAQYGLAAAGCTAPGAGGEIDSLNVVNAQDCTDVILENPDMIVGVKVRLAAEIADNGRNEQEAYRRALKASADAKVPLMVHHARSNVLHIGQQGELGCPGDLRPGDIYTHCYTAQKGGPIDPATGQVAKAVWEAKRRGVLYDVGHGRGSFFWRVAEQCSKEGWWPDIISTDLHTQSSDGPAYDLMCAMSRMLHLGMHINDVIKAVTSAPAIAIGKLSEIGCLSVGQVADVTVLRVDVIDEELEDSEGATRRVRKAFTPIAVLREGRSCDVTQERPWPNAEVKAKMVAILESWDKTEKEGAGK